MQSKKYDGWFSMGERGLAYPVYEGKKIAIPAGTTGVTIGFGKSNIEYDAPDGRRRRLNVYITADNRVVHGTDRVFFKFKR